MTEEIKKPRRKRRTKAQIEADNAAEKSTAPVKIEKPEKTKEETVVVEQSKKVPAPKEDEYVPLTGLAKIRHRYAQRLKVDQGR